MVLTIHLGERAITVQYSGQIAPNWWAPQVPTCQQYIYEASNPTH